MPVRLSILSLSFLLLIPALEAQPVLTPSPDRTGSGNRNGVDPGVDVGNYNVTHSFETGYRFTTVGGDAGLFRSVENYGNGWRLFGGTFTANSKNGRGKLFDTFSLSASGLGNDPYGMTNVRVEKNHTYRYDLTWRRNEYYNPSQLNGESATLKNTRRTVQDHDLTINATSWAKLLLGYTRNHETGPEFTAYETYIGGLARSLLPLSRDTRRDFNEYRLGTELDFLGFKLSITHRWEYFKDDSSIASLVPGQPYAASGFLNTVPYDLSLESKGNPQVATAYLRSQPMHIQNRIWFGNLTRQQKYWAINARVTYNKGDSQTFYYENQTGASQAAATSVPTGDGRFLSSSNSGYGPTATAYTYMPGTARRPFTAGDFSFTLFPTRKWTIMNSTSAQSLGYDGTGNELRVISNGAAIINRFWNFQIKQRRLSDSLDTTYKLNKWLGLNAEYRYTYRFINNNIVRTGTTVGQDLSLGSNHLNTGTLGFHLKPLHQLTISADGTIGRDNHPENPTSPANFHNIRARADYRAKKMHFGLVYRQVYNVNNPLSVFSSSTGQLTIGSQLDYFDSHSRDFSANTSFDANKHLAFDLSYNKAHVDTLANLWAELVPAVSTTTTTLSTRGYSSQYISNLHTVSLSARLTFNRGTFYAGYNISRDTGDGRNVQNLGLTNIAASYTAAWTTFPMTYQSPMARISYKLSPKVQWNGGWEFYRYNQKFAYYGYQPYYRAHTGYTSLSFSF